MACTINSEGGTFTSILIDVFKSFTQVINMKVLLKSLCSVVTDID